MSFLDNVTPAEKEKIDMCVAEFFYGCNVPFAAIDSIYFKNLMKMLRPAYDPPSRRQLSGKLLDATFEKIEKRNRELVEKMDKEAVLLIDGWTNSSANRQYVATMLATADDQKVFLESFDFSSTRETGINLFDAAKVSIDLAKERYDANVYGGSSDNASNMQTMGQLLESMGLLYSTCHAHTANLLAGDILKKPRYSSIMSKVMTVQKDFRRIGLEDRLLRSGGRKPVLFGNTRWVSQRNAAQSFLENLPAMKKVVSLCDEEKKIQRH